MLGGVESIEDTSNIQEISIADDIEQDTVVAPTLQTSDEFHLLTDLPYEILILIFGQLDPKSAQALSLSSKLFHHLSSSVSARSALLLNHYGKGSCIFSLYNSHKALLSVDLIQCLLLNGGIFPRFLAQIVVQDFQSRTRAVPAIAIYVFSIKYAFEKYLEMSEFKSNDHRVFESLVRVSPQPAEEAQDAINGLSDLITKYKFFPIPDRSFRLLGESLYLMANLDINLISLLVLHTGFTVEPYNDKVMDRLFQQVTITENQVRNYLQVGFSLSDYVIKRAVAFGRPQVFEILDSLMIEVDDRKRLLQLIENTIYELFGPYLDRHTSLNVPWNSEAVSRIINHYRVPSAVVRSALLTHPEENSSFEAVHESFPVTRPYLKSKPYAIWRWVLDEYGPHHPHTTACFDDALSRAVSDEALHDLLDYFVECGFVMRPRHIKILACRVLHRNMTTNALDVMKLLVLQVRERHRKSLVQQQFPNLQTDIVSLIEPPELALFKEALNRDMLQNREWKERSRSIQLGSGHSGGTYRIDRAPSDVIRFTEEATKLMGDLIYWEKQLAKMETEGKETQPKGYSTSDTSKPVSTTSKFKNIVQGSSVLRTFRTYFACFSP